MRLDVGVEDGAVVLRCADDGCGVDPVRREQGIREGHLGLAACTEWVEAIGGTFEVVTGPGLGTVVRAVLPGAGARRSPPDAAYAAAGGTAAVQNAQRVAAVGIALRHSGQSRVGRSTSGSVRRRAISAFTGLRTRK